MRSVADRSSVTINTGDGREIALATRQDVWEAQAANARLFTAIHETLKEQQQILREHGQELRFQRTTLERHGELLERQGRTMECQGHTLDQIACDVQGIKDHLGIR